jgi:hypothetical protein
MISLLWFLYLSLLLFSSDSGVFPSTFVFPSYKHSYGIRKAGPTELFLLMGLKVRFNNPQGIACVRLDAWEDPEDPHDDDKLTVYGVNSGQNNVIYNRSMWALDVYGKDETGEQRLNQPHGICANSKGDVYIADSGNHRIVRLFNAGNKLKFKTAFGNRGSNMGAFQYPRQVALDNTGNLYVTDTGNHRIQVFDKENKPVTSFSNGNQLLSPNGLAVTDIKEKYQYQGENFIIVIDSSNARINKFDFLGLLLAQTRMQKLNYNKTNLQFVCIDYYNQILITDFDNHCLHKFDKNLNHIVSFGSEGDDDHEFTQPRGISIYRRFGQIFIAEKKGAQYYWVGTDLEEINIDAKRNTVIFNFYITEPSFISASIFNNEDSLMIKLTDKLFFSKAGYQRLLWNKRKQNIGQKQDRSSKNKALVTPGVYHFRLNAEATYSSRTYFKKTVDKQFRIEM